ncbi:hypothetical protein CEXT_555061 [Caerostris extrusa]|uniref:Secreted protein n=1 Tax=Caerostris extrusa TaxID=172846 RepID=A0AAV4XPY9_CAEEX|nr:hypothetical protein CEXT_555061 [Caerostris extrusa]
MRRLLCADLMQSVVFSFLMQRLFDFHNTCTLTLSRVNLNFVVNLRRGILADGNQPAVCEGCPSCMYHTTVVEWCTWCTIPMSSMVYVLCYDSRMVSNVHVPIPLPWNGVLGVPYQCRPWCLHSKHLCD